MQTSSPTENESKWKFAQCFGDKGESDDITEGNALY
jgi:serine/threonine-protein phosphatase 2A regulatory subunit B